MFSQSKKVSDIVTFGKAAGKVQCRKFLCFIGLTTLFLRHPTSFRRGDFPPRFRLSGEGPDENTPSQFFVLEISINLRLFQCPIFPPTPSTLHTPRGPGRSDRFLRLFSNFVFAGSLTGFLAVFLCTQPHLAQPKIPFQYLIQLIIM